MKAFKLSKRFLGFISAAVIVIITIAVFFIVNAISRPEEKPIKLMQGMWAYEDITSATENAEFIVYGRVVDISKTKVHEENDSLGNPFREYYKDVTIEVISQIKGTNTDSTVTYIEMGGESDEYIYVLEGYEPLSISDEIILFANKHGAFLAPETLIRVTDGEITPAEQMLPENLAATYSDTSSINVSDYLEAVEAGLKE